MKISIGDTMRTTVIIIIAIQLYTRCHRDQIYISTQRSCEACTTRRSQSYTHTRIGLLACLYVFNLESDWYSSVRFVVVIVPYNHVYGIYNITRVRIYHAVTLRPGIRTNITVEVSILVCTKVYEYTARASAFWTGIIRLFSIDRLCRRNKKKRKKKM